MLIGLKSPYNAVNSTYSLTTNEFRRDSGFNPSIFETETSDWGSSPTSLLIPVAGRNKNSYPVGNRTNECLATRWREDRLNNK